MTASAADTVAIKSSFFVAELSMLIGGRSEFDHRASGRHVILGFELVLPEERRRFLAKASESQASALATK